jgi:hypothetical protein
MLVKAGRYAEHFEQKFVGFISPEDGKGIVKPVSGYRKSVEAR